MSNTPSTRMVLLKYTKQTYQDKLIIINHYKEEYDLIDKYQLTSSQTEVVSLPVNRYWPIKIVSPSFTACRKKPISINTTTQVIKN